MTNELKTAIREAVHYAMEYYPNSHLGDCSRREDMHSAFRVIRAHNAVKNDLWHAVGCLNRQVDSYVDM